MDHFLYNCSLSSSKFLEIQISKYKALSKLLNQTRFLRPKSSQHPIPTTRCQPQISFQHLVWLSPRTPAMVPPSLHQTSTSLLSLLSDPKEAPLQDFIPGSPSPYQTLRHRLISTRPFPDAHRQASCSAQQTFRPTRVHQCTAL